MRSFASALVALLATAVPSYADEPQQGVEVAAVIGAAQATAETATGYATTADCKVTGSVMPNRTISVVVAARTVATAPSGIQAISSTIRCVLSDADGRVHDAVKASGGNVSATAEAASGFSRTGLTVCASGDGRFVTGVQLSTVVVCAPVVVVSV